MMTLRDLLTVLPDLINGVFYVMELLVVRLTLLGLTVLGAYHLLLRK
jgi:hypothetical protein